MKEIIVHDIGELLKEVENIIGDAGGKEMWYRGQVSKDWKLLPSVQRGRDYREELERELVVDFRIRASQVLRDHPGKNDYSGWMSLMQHYGLATRLMDWSKSPLVALYFATEPAKKDRDELQDACIWILCPSVLNAHEIGQEYIYPIDSVTVEEMLEKAFKVPDMGDRGENQPLGYGHIVACEPVEHNLRIYSQMACFTVHDAKKEMPMLVNIAEEVPDMLNKIIIPAQLKECFRKELAVLGITESYIYPDMEHIARDIKKKHRY